MEEVLPGEQVTDTVQLQDSDKLGASIFEGIVAYASTYIGIFLLLAFLFIMIMIIISRRRFARIESEKVDKSITYKNSDVEAVSGKFSLKSSINRIFNQPTNPARKMVYQFERKVANTSFARNADETIEAWFSRVGIKADLSIYQKVRYGEVNISGDELDILRKQIKEIEGNKRKG